MSSTIFARFAASVVILATTGAIAAGLAQATGAPPTVIGGAPAVVSLVDQPGGARQVAMGADNVAPGDTIERMVTLENGGAGAWRHASVSTFARGDAILTAGRADALQIAIDVCSEAWLRSSSRGSAATWRCAGRSTSVVGWRPARVDAAALGAPVLLGSGQRAHLRVRLALPAAAGNEFQGKAATLVVTFQVS